MLEREGIRICHKMVRRLYKEEGPAMKRRRGRERATGTRAPQEAPQCPNERWSLDFLSDVFEPGRRFRILAVIDDCTSESLALVADTSLSGQRVARELDSLIRIYGKPVSIASDNGTELNNRAILEWQNKTGIAWHYIAPGRPTDNGFIEAFNSKFRAECLNAHWFMTLADAREKLVDWRRDYNEVRPHSAIGYKVPVDMHNSGDVTCSSSSSKPENSNPRRSKLRSQSSRTWTLLMNEGAIEPRSDAMTTRHR